MTETLDRPDLQSVPDLAAIRAAHARIAPYVHRTPLLTSATLDEAAGARLCFKAENLQKVGAFKARGATNAVLSLSDAEAARGVVTHSSGNHAAALARAAGIRGIPAHIVMPSNAPVTKIESVRRYGGRVILCEPTLAARESTAAAVMAETGATFVHPYDDPRVIAGQGTAALELLEQAAELGIGPLDLVLVPIGGGGLTSGTAIAVRAISPATRVIAVEPEAADDAARSVAAGRLIPLEQPAGSTPTIADGLRTSLSERTFGVVRRDVESVITVPEAAIVAAMRTLWSVLKSIVEPSGAVPYAPFIVEPRRFAGLRVGIVLSGGNLDLDKLPW